MAALKAKEVMAMVRAKLDYPSPETLKDPTLLLSVQEKSEHYFNRINLTQRDWFIGTWDLTAINNVDEYLVSAPDWGRAISCETFDSSDPYNHFRREIQIGDFHDRDLFYQGSTKAGNNLSSADQHSAEFVAFYRKSADNLLYLQLTPMPGQSAEYRFWYEPNRPTPARLTSNLLFLEAFRGLLVTDVALSCLPYCRYEPAFAAPLMNNLMRELQEYSQTFEEYVRNNNVQQAGPKQQWGVPFGYDTFDPFI